LAAYFGVGAIAQLLLDRGADVKAADSGRQTPVYWAAHMGHREVVQLLLDRGANVKAAILAERRRRAYKTGSKMSTSCK